jgi:hypothetical protein
MIWVKITASEQDIESFCYKPLVSSNIYQAEQVGDSSNFYDVFYGDEYVVRGVWSGRLKVLTIDEVREYKLNELGI